MLLRLLALGWLALSPVSDLAAQESPALTRVAFASCANQDKPCPIWQTLHDAKPELLIMLGDTIYADLDRSVKVTPKVIRSKYEILDGLPAFQQIKKNVPILATYDDHDYGKNDGDATWALKDDAQKILLDFLNVPADSPRRMRKGVYHAEIYGPPGQRVQVIMLDGRYHRSPLKQERFDPRTRISAYIPSTDPTHTMLGEEQWAWLEEELQKPAELRLIGSGIQVISEEHPFEKWMNFPLEREKLYNLIRRTRANGVIFLSGDRHLGELSIEPTAVGYPLYDVTSSGLNQASQNWRAPETNRHRVASVPYGNNFGMIMVDWNAEGGPKVSMQLRDEQGENYFNHTIRLALLTPKEIIDEEPATPLPEGVITPAAAAKMIGETVTLQFRVNSARLSGTRMFLNSKSDFRDPDNFTVLLQGKALTETFKDAKAETFQGQIIRVKGKVGNYNQRPEIIVTEGSDLEIVKP